jgi:hypothetical protein
MHLGKDLQEVLLTYSYLGSQYSGEGMPPISNGEEDREYHI